MATDTIREQRQLYRKEMGLRIKALRESKGMTQSELAKAAALPQPTISAIEVGNRQATPQQRASVAAVFSIDQGQLDPLVTPRFTLAGIVQQAASGRMAPMSVVARTRELPPGYEDFNERHGKRLGINRREDWYLKSSRFDAEPWVEFDDQFWTEMLEF